MSTARRRAALAASLADLDVDAALVTHLPNVRYLTGFTGSFGATLIDRDGNAWLATDNRYAELAGKQSPDVDVVVTRVLGPDLLRRAANGCVAVERQHLTLAAYDGLAGVGPELAPTDDLVEPLRVQKDDVEIAALRTACAVTDAAFAAVIQQLQPGVTEREIAWLLLQAIRGSGGDGVAFDSIVAFGPNSAVPHHQPTERALERGDLVKLDFGAQVDGYHADMTRTVVSGPASDWQSELHEAVAAVQRHCRDETKPGALPADLNDLAETLIRDAGHEPLHGLGHGVGLQIHEAPFLTPGTDAAKLAARVPVTVEPGIYLPGRGGVRIEDTVLVTDDGAEPLTTSPRDLLEI